MISTTAITWNTMNLLGGCSLLFLLATYYFVKSLPQRKNPFLVNLILISYLSTGPPLLLLFTGQQGRIRIQWICTLQAACINSIPSTFGFAFVVLVFQTWSEMRAHTQGTTCILGRFIYLKWMLIFAPYINFLGWFMASLISMLLPSARAGLNTFVFCAIDGHDDLRTRGGYFTAACMGTAVLLEVWIVISVCACLRRCRVSGDLPHASSVYRANLHMCMRFFAFSVIQLSPILLTALSGFHVEPLKVRNATQIIGSIFPLSAFIVFGTQRTILQAWRILPPTAQVEKSDLV